MCLSPRILILYIILLYRGEKFIKGFEKIEKKGLVFYKPVKTEAYYVLPTQVMYPLVIMNENLLLGWQIAFVFQICKLLT